MKFFTRISIPIVFITSTISTPWDPAPKGPANHGKTCIVQALGDQKDDTPQILKAFEECNNGGIIVFPEDQNYWIGTKLHPVIKDVTIEWKGTWTLSDNLDYWRNSSYPIAFQNHRAGFIISGERIHINGYGRGGINGNGNAWYNVEQAVTQPGRPMPFVFWNTIFVKDSPLWALNIMNGTNMWFDHIACNSTALNAPVGVNWVQNTDGFDTMDSNYIALTNMWYQGGDDCIAIKPRSYNIYVQNITCHGGNGIAIGSLGQYLEDSSVENVTVKDANIISYNNDMHNSAYIKTYVGALVPQSGYESAGLPRGGGWGVVRNILFQNFKIRGAGIGPNINQDSGNNGSFSGTSKMLVSGVKFVDFEGYMTGAKGNRTAVVSCSTVRPCYGIELDGMKLASSENATEVGAQGTCSYVEEGGVKGLTGAGC
ncbi:putative galacturan 1,4-alpha-galacturonidase C [Lachnellula subtilissima]|uniref:galacturonan 1,4-alpha-galacturonidase n=1 Tax=Lachnellula subtilissima TaxID=602034 RepID=A0A8H8UD91_9HELO|nr:putative galacturan 1,4-alpha-galacturonidase C [Lachnellula subtilissima]